MLKLHDKVITPDREQGFVTCIYAGGEVDVDIRCEESEDNDMTVTVDYDSAAVLEIVDGIPCVGDITPFGTVIRVIKNLEDIATCCFRDNSRVAWFGNRWVNNLPDDYGKDDIQNWVEVDDFDYLLEHFDLEYIGYETLREKALKHPDIAFDCKVEVMTKEGRFMTWNAHVNGCGDISRIMPDTEGYPEEITLLSQLRETGIIEANLVSKYHITNF